jgi:two-component system OmpR family sensor kinase
MIGNEAINGFAYTPSWRVFTLRHATAPLRIHVADSRAHRRDELVSIWMWTLLPLLAVFPGIAWVIRRVTKHSLAPVESLVSEIAKRGVTNMSPVGGSGLPPEMQMICDSTNHLLTRLKDALDIERSLAANAAHELRTPLAAARLRLASALDQSLPETARMAMDEAAASLERLARRAEKLLQMSRAESSAALVRETVDLGALACDVAEDFWRDPDVSKRLKVQISRDEPITTIGDADALALALRNLIENALRYAPGASVKVKVMEPATIIVRDLGPGVDAATLDVISTRHVRRSNNHGGYGLGLSIVNTVVDRHNGKMRLYSPAPGHHAGFAVALAFKPANDLDEIALAEHTAQHRSEA